MISAFADDGVLDRYAERAAREAIQADHLVLKGLLVCLLITILTEYFCYRVFFKIKKEHFLDCVLINSLTNPLVVLFFSFNQNVGLDKLLLIESFVVLVEAILIGILLKQKPRRALIISFVSNFASMIAWVLCLLFADHWSEMHHFLR